LATKMVAKSIIIKNFIKIYISSEKSQYKKQQTIYLHWFHIHTLFDHQKNNIIIIVSSF
uniref:Uncharacterized protein n=1 Tax=Amphimedon queenslandica TaxID=400682 RepID=A0A1X7TKH1_AMPQE